MNMETKEPLDFLRGREKGEEEKEDGGNRNSDKEKETKEKKPEVNQYTPEHFWQQEVEPAVRDYFSKEERWLMIDLEKTIKRRVKFEIPNQYDIILV